MSLNSFLQNKGIQTNTTQASGSLSNFLSQRQGQQTQSTQTQTTTPNITKPVEKSNEQSTIKDAWRWVGKQLNKGNGVVAKELRGVGEMLGNLISISSPRVDADEGLKNAAKSIIDAQVGSWNIITGKEETNLLKEFEATGELTTLDKVMGIGGEFVLDPLWVTKPVKAVQKIGQVTKLEKPAKVLADVVKQLPASQKMKAIFTNTTGNKEFDAIVGKFRSLQSYREGKNLKEAIDLQKELSGLKKSGIKNIESLVTNGLEKPKTLAGKPEEVINIVNDLKSKYFTLLNDANKVGLSIGEIKNYAPHIRTKESFLNQTKQLLGQGSKEFSKGSIEKGRKLTGTIEELTDAGIDIFEKNPAIQLVKKGQAYAKAITSQEFANAVKKFAVEDGVEVTNTMLKGLKFSPEQARVIDNYYQGIRPEELNFVLKGFDKIQNFWKTQALVSPSYHTRNMVGNFWNNFLAGVNPADYMKAGMIQKGLLKDAKSLELLDEAKKVGAIDEGWFAADIAEEVVNSVDSIGKWSKSINPLSRQNALFKLNKNIGSAVENNARLAHYMSKRNAGMTAEEAAQSVKKYLFDYKDLTTIEKNVLKRALPFYTWTRKNIPLQLEQLVTQPAKYVLPHKVVNMIESGVEVPQEKYMGQYLKENVPMRTRTNEDGTTEYFLLGNWLPYAQAIDFLSNPLDNFINMTTPLIKAPIEYGANLSSFFKTTTGEPSPIESYYKQQGEFGVDLKSALNGEIKPAVLRRKNIQLLRNIRILSDIDKWIDKQDPKTTKDSWQVKALETLFGKSATYDVAQSKYFYDIDTDNRIKDLKAAIKSAQKKGNEDKANELKLELQKFKESR